MHTMSFQAVPIKVSQHYCENIPKFMKEDALRALSIQLSMKIIDPFNIHWSNIEQDDLTVIANSVV